MKGERIDHNGDHDSELLVTMRQLKDTALEYFEDKSGRLRELTAEVEHGSDVLLFRRVLRLHCIHRL